MNDLNRAISLALKATHSSEWLFVLFISSCCLRICDETMRVAVELHLGLNLCEAHTSSSGATVSTRGTHGQSCKRSTGRATPQHQINVLIGRALKRSDISATKEPTGLLRDDGKRPDGHIHVPWQKGWYLTWDATVFDSLASSYLSQTSSLPGSAADAASGRTKEIEICRYHAGPNFRPSSS